MHPQLAFDNRCLPGRAPGLARRLAWLIGVGLLCCLLGLFMGAPAAAPAAAESTGAAQLASHASLAVDGALPMCVRLPANGLCMDAESGDPTDPATLPTLSLPLPPLHGFAGQAAPAALAQATPQPLLRPPRRQG